jgi:hypothetical protein
LVAPSIPSNPERGVYPAIKTFRWTNNINSGHFKSMAFASLSQFVSSMVAFMTVAFHQDGY